ncbi:MAG: hypothetical protein KI788_20215 [Mameliella sp.]|nr:hypothetical protein [Mameliella sp.]
MARFGLTLAFLLPFLPAAVAAQDYDTRTLMQHRQWQVDVTYSQSSDSYWCTAGVENGSTQKFNLVAYQNEAFALFIFDPRWNLEARPVSFVVDVDRNRWNMDGSGEGTGIALSMTDAEKAAKFLVQLKRGNSVYVYNDKQQRQATFSLSGSSRAIDALFECWDTIVGSQDPF